MLNSMVKGAFGAGTMASLMALCACSSDAADGNSAEARKKIAITTPTPVATQTPTPTSTTTTTVTTDNPQTGQSPGVGAADIATSDHDVNDDLMPAWGSGAIPVSNAPDVVGAFRFICRHTNLAFDDPTVHPGQPGASHLHDQTGVNGWNASSTYGNLRTGGGGSGCNDV